MTQSVENEVDLHLYIARNAAGETVWLPEYMLANCVVDYDVDHDWQSLRHRSHR